MDPETYAKEGNALKISRVKDTFITVEELLNKKAELEKQIDALQTELRKTNKLLLKAENLGVPASTAITQ